jgi:hypothetical protein
MSGGRVIGVWVLSRREELCEKGLGALWVRGDKVRRATGALGEREQDEEGRRCSR